MKIRAKCDVCHKDCPTHKLTKGVVADVPECFAKPLIEAGKAEEYSEPKTATRSLKGVSSAVKKTAKKSSPKG